MGKNSVDGICSLDTTLRTQLIGIIAVGSHGEIGLKNKLPWSLPADLHHFKQATMGSPIIMGAQTFVSLGRILPGRPHYVLSRTLSLDHPQVTICQHMPDLLQELNKKNYPRAFVIGGLQIYNLFMPLISEFLVTKIDASFEADTFLPLDFFNEFQGETIIDWKKDANNQYDFKIIHYKKES